LGKSFLFGISGCEDVSGLSLAHQQTGSPHDAIFGRRPVASAGSGRTQLGAQTPLGSDSSITMECIMTVTTDTIIAINRDFARLSLSEDRLEPVRLEMDQFAAGIEAVRTRLTFDSEPADFTAALTADAGSTHRG